MSERAGAMAVQKGTNFIETYLLFEGHCVSFRYLFFISFMGCFVTFLFSWDSCLLAVASEWLTFIGIMVKHYTDKG
jgi:hypothetical protein